MYEYNFVALRCNNSNSN